MEEFLAQLGASWSDLGVVVVAASAIYLWVIAATRLMGLRSFSKMSAFDFAMTVAIGSAIAATALGTAPLAHGAVAVAVLFVAQFLVALLRRWTAADRLVDNAPLLLMEGPRILDDHLAKARLTRDDLYAKLRSANVLALDDIHAVVFETTGDVSVLHGRGRLDARLLASVRGGAGTSDHPTEE